jgi:opacity protein-like surface antigen
MIMMDNVKSQAAAFLFVLTLAWFGSFDVTVWAGGTFYVAPKAFLGPQGAQYEPSSFEVKNINPPYLFNHTGIFFGNGVKTENSQTYGALSFGVDLFNTFRIPFRLEFEISTKVDSKSKGSLKNIVLDQVYDCYAWIDEQYLSYTTNTAYINIFYDFHNITNFIPYIGGGFGFAFISGRASIIAGFQDTWGTDPLNPTGVKGINTRNSAPEFDKKDSIFSWHLDLGISYNINDYIIANLGYRYTKISEPLNLGDSIASGTAYTNEITSVQAEWTLAGPSKILFKPTHQIIMGFQYFFI